MKRLVDTVSLESSDCGAWLEWLLWQREEQPTHHWFIGREQKVREGRGYRDLQDVGQRLFCYSRAGWRSCREPPKNPQMCLRKSQHVAPASQGHLSYKTLPRFL